VKKELQVRAADREVGRRLWQPGFVSGTAAAISARLGNEKLTAMPSDAFDVLLKTSLAGRLD